MDFEANRETAHQSDTADFTPGHAPVPASLASVAAAAAAAGAAPGAEAKVLPANAIALTPDGNGVIVLPAGVTLDDLEVIGRDLVITMPDGRVYVVHDGAVYVPQLVVDGVEVPPLNLAALLTGAEPQPAAGTAVTSSGGNFADPVGNIQPAYDLGDLLPYTELAFPQVQVQEIYPAINHLPDVLIQDGGPASHDAIDEVNENGLPNPRLGGAVESPGSAFGNNAQITTGTIFVDSQDGIASLTINGVQYTGVAGQTITGSFGTLTLGELQNGQISYTYTLTDNTSGDATKDVFTVVLTDPQGDSATAKLTVNIVDDVPTAFANTNTVSEGATVAGNVVIDATRDVFGADGPVSPTGGVTGVATGSVITSAVTGGLGGIRGQYGTLTLSANGSYTYKADANITTSAALVDHFVYTITDGDGDTSTTTLDITINNVTVTATDSDALVNEKGLAAGGSGENADGIAGNNSDPSESYTGTIAASGGTGPYTIALSGGGTGTYGTLVLGSNGTYTYTLTRPFDTTPDANNGTQTETGKDNFNYTVTDANGNTATGTISVSIVDDVPKIDVVASGEAEILLTTHDALTIGTNSDTASSSANFSGVFALNAAGTAGGADGTASQGIAYALNVTGAASGLSSHGNAITLLKLASGAVVGYTGGTAPTAETDASVVFSVKVAGTGVVTLTQYQQIDHPLPGSTSSFDSQVVALADGHISLTATATIVDNDGDTATDTATIDLGGNLRFADDGPTSDGTAAGSSVTIDETTAGTPAGFGASGISATSAAAMISATGAFGADGAAATGSLSYGLAITNTTAGATPLKTAIGDFPITLVQVDADTIEGRYNGANVAFRLDIAGDGKLTITQFVPLEHNVDGSTSAAYNDALNLMDGQNSLVSATVTLKDFDGDTATASVAIGNAITILDDGPKIDVTATSEATILLTTHDALTPGTGSESVTTTANFSGVFALNAAGTAGGADGTASQGIAYGLDVTGAASGLSSHGNAITLLKLSGGTVVGYTGGTAPTAETDASVVFSVKVATDGTVTLTQYQQIDHALPGSTSNYDSQLATLADGHISLTATATIVDNDGDTATDTATIDLGGNLRFADDGPSLSGVGVGSSVSVDETTAGTPAGFGAGGISATSAGAVISATTAFGADGAAATGSVSYGLAITNTTAGATPLKTAIGDFPITLVQVDADTIEGRYNGANVAFRLDIGSGGALTITQFVPLEHNVDGSTSAAYNDALNLMDGQNSLVSATVTLKDFDGDTATASVAIGNAITILDDGPHAVNDGTFTVAEQTALPISVLTNDSFGADGGSQATGVALATAPTKGSVTYDPNTGQFTYTPNAGASGSDSFTYTITDNDGDTSTATVSLTLAPDSVPNILATTNLNVDEDGLTGANADANPLQVSPTEIAGTNLRTASGTATVNFGADTPTNLAASIVLLDTSGLDTQIKTLDGNFVTFGLESGALVGRSSSGTEVLRIAITNAQPGSNASEVVYTYTVTLSQPIQHPTAGTEDTVTLTGVSFQVTDSDGSPGTGSFSVTVRDDVPSIDVIKGTETGILLTTHDALTPGSGFESVSTTANFSNVFSVSATVGIDGQASQTLSYGLNVLTGTSGLSSHGNAITLLKLSGGTVVGYTGGTAPTLETDASVVFSVKVTNAGVVTLTQYQQLDHSTVSTAAPYDTDLTVLADGKITLTATASVTDRDGDVATDSETVDLGGNLRFADDGPSATTGTTGPSVTVDETTAGSPAGFGAGGISATSATAMVVSTVAYGADGPATTGSLVYGLVITNTTAGATPLKTAIGDFPITLVQVDGDTIEGRYNGANVAFRVDIGSDGRVTLTEFVPLEHNTDGSTPAAYNDALTLTLADGTTSLISATVTPKDFDGDTATTSAAIGTGLIFLDDGPKIDVTATGETAILLTTHDALTAGSSFDTAATTANFSDVFAINGAGTSGGADGTASQTVAYGLNVLTGTSGLSSHGNAITLLKLSGGTVVGYTGGAAPTAETDASVVFSVKVSSGGTVTLIQYQQVDHSTVSTAAPYDTDLATLADGKITLTATATIFDNDGDSATDTATIDLGGNIRFADDGPSLSSVAAGAAVTVDETTAGSLTGFGVSGISATSASAVITASALYGADGPAATSLLYGLVITGGGATPLKTTVGGYAVSLFQVDTDTIEGRYNGSNVAFRLDIAGDGKLTITQFVPLDHALDGSSAAALNDPLTLTSALGASLVSATITAKDFDGDTASGSVAIGANITILDDGPQITSVTTPLAIANSGDVAGTGLFAFSTGADGPGTGNDAIKDVTFAATVNNVAASATTFTPGTEDATTAHYDFSFTYSIGSSTTTTTSGTLVFDKGAGTYTVDLDGPVQGFSISSTSQGTLFQGYELNSATTTGSQPPVAITQIGTNLFVQFTSVAEPGSGTGANNLYTTNYALDPTPPSDGLAGTFSNGELITQQASWVSASNAANGVGGDTIGGGEVLDFNLYATNKQGFVGDAPTASATSMFLKFDGIGASEDFIVVLKLYDPGTHEYTTRALIVQNADILKGPGSGSGIYSGVTLDNNDGLIVIESNDYNASGEHFVIVGAQIAASDEGITGQGYDFNSLLGTSGGSTTAALQSFATDVNDGPMKVSDIGFVTTSTTAQTAQLTFNVTVQDGDGDTASQTLVVNVGSTPPVVIDLDGDGAEFLGLNAGVTYDYGHGLVATAWAGADDGILAVDLNHDGKVSSASEFVFGGDGLTDLAGVAAVYDSNHDGVLDAQDAAFAQFGVWQDANSNGVADAGEFHTLTELGITSIKLTSDGVSYTAANGDVTVAGTTTVTYADNTTTTAADASFALARLSQQVENAVTAAAAGSLVTAAVAAAVIVDSSETPVAPAPSDGDGTFVADTSNDPAPTSEPAPTTSTLLADTSGDPAPTGQQETQHTADEPSHPSVFNDTAADHAPAVAVDATGGDGAAHLVAAIVSDAGGSIQAMDALLAAGQGAGSAPAPAVASAAQPVVGEVLAEGHAASFVDSLLDHVVGHDGGAAPQVSSPDLSALLAAHVDGGVGAVPAPMPVVPIDHAEMVAAVAHA